LSVVRIGLEEYPDALMSCTVGCKLFMGAFAPFN
jgi:hypothetical protein